MTSTLRVFTEMHLKTAGAMPRKSPGLWLGSKEDAKWRRRAKRERKVIAQYYRLVRSMPEIGDWKTAHRYGIVTSPNEARVRIRNLKGVAQ